MGWTGDSGVACKSETHWQGGAAFIVPQRGIWDENRKSTPRATEIQLRVNTAVKGRGGYEAEQRALCVPRNVSGFRHLNNLAYPQTPTGGPGPHASHTPSEDDQSVRANTGPRLDFRSS